MGVGTDQGLRSRARFRRVKTTASRSQSEARIQRHGPDSRHHLPLPLRRRKQRRDKQRTGSHLHNATAGQNVSTEAATEVTTSLATLHGSFDIDPSGLRSKAATPTTTSSSARRPPTAACRQASGHRRGLDPRPPIGEFDHRSAAGNNLPLPDSRHQRIRHGQRQRSELHDAPASHRSCDHIRERDGDNGRTGRAGQSARQWDDLSVRIRNDTGVRPSDTCRRRRNRHG